jgi:hypothetical protein
MSVGIDPKYLQATIYLYPSASAARDGGLGWRVGLHSRRNVIGQLTHLSVRCDEQASTRSPSNWRSQWTSWFELAMVWSTNF